MGRLRSTVAGLTALTAVSAGVLVGVQPATAARAPIVVWASDVTAPVLEAAYADGFDGRTVAVVVKDPALIASDLAAVGAEDAPDIIQMEHRNVGGLAAVGAIVTVDVPSKVQAKFPANVWSGFAASGDAYGIPVAISNVALVTNASLVPTQPKDFASLSKAGSALAASGKAKLPLAVGQGPEGNAETTYPLFSGLGGYILGATSAGVVSVDDVGIANPAFLAQTPRIDEWNATKFLRSTVTPERARSVFLAGKAPFWIAPVAELQSIMGLKFGYRITEVPSLISGTKASPMLTMTGFALTPWAETHGVASEASGLLVTGLSGKKIQNSLATALNLVPAASSAQKAMATTGAAARLRAFALAGINGVAAPSVPQQAEILAALAQAWVVSTSGPSATPAKKAFKNAQAATNAVLAG